MKKILNLIMISLLMGCSSTTAKDNATKQVQHQSPSSIPPISSFTFELCNVYFVLNECATFPNEQKHWGEVKEIKIFNVSEIKQLPQKNSLQVYVKSQGCYGYYDSPQKEAWYPISKITWAREGKTPKTSLVNNTVMEPKLREAFVQINGNAPQMMPEQCDPIEIE